MPLSQAALAEEAGFKPKSAGVARAAFSLFALAKTNGRCGVNRGFAALRPLLLLVPCAIQRMSGGGGGSGIRTQKHSRSERVIFAPGFVKDKCEERAKSWVRYPPPAPVQPHAPSGAWGWAGGGSGIRTHDTVSRIHAFQASAFSHSATPPQRENRAQYSGGGSTYNPRATREQPARAPRGIGPRAGQPVENRAKSAAELSPRVSRYSASSNEATPEAVMGRGLLLWLIGIPLPIILLIWVLGGLHG